MSALTDSIRLTDLGPAFGGYSPERTAAVTRFECQAQTIELDPVFPGLEIVAKLAGALSRSADESRDEA